MLKKIIVSSFCFIVLSSCSYATVLDANSKQGQFELGVGTVLFGGSAMTEFGINDQLSVGADATSVNVTLLPIFLILKAFGASGTPYVDVYDAHLNYQIVESNPAQPFNVSCLLGYESLLTRIDNTVTGTTAGPEAGLCLSASLGSLTGRLNLVGAFFPEGTLIGLPAGVELAWKPIDLFEINAGFTGTGVLGCKIIF